MERHIRVADLYIMLVEPSRTQCHVVQDQLTKIGVSQVKVCKSGEDVLAEISAAVPDLVISAMYLPDMSGADLVIKMRSKDFLRDVGFILISSEDDFHRLDPVKQAGVMAIIHKPFTVDDLNRALYITLDFLESEELVLQNHVADEVAVLVVDDSMMARHHIMRTLNALGIKNIDEAVDGKDAVDKIADNFYDLIVTDYNMPVMNGAELIVHIREESNQASVPILMVTSEENTELLASVEKSGVSALCDKPFDLNTVRGLIQDIVV